MQILKLATIVSILFFTGCASIPESQVSTVNFAAPSLQPSPVLISTAGVAAQSPVPSVISVRVPIKWNYKDSWKWKEENFPQPGDSVRILIDAGKYFSGIVIKSTAKTEAETTAISLLLDADSNHKADARAELVIEDKKVASRIRTSFEEIEEK